MVDWDINYEHNSNVVFFRFSTCVNNRPNKIYEWATSFLENSCDSFRFFQNRRSFVGQDHASLSIRWRDLWLLVTFQVNLEGCLVPENSPRTLPALDFFRFCVFHHFMDVKGLGGFQIFSTSDAGKGFCACMYLSMMLQLLDFWKCLVTWLTQEASLIFSMNQQVAFQFMIAWESQTTPITRPMFCNLGILKWPRRIFF